MSWRSSDGTRWRDGEFGWFYFIALGGPLDHFKYTWARMPSGIPVQLCIPVRQPSHFSPMAKYVRVGDPLCEAGTGIIYHEFLFDGYVDPDHLERLTDATAAIEEMLNLAAQAQRVDSAPVANRRHPAPEPDQLDARR